ncbi:MAG TPA: FtsX-like permease family protein [Thermoplasmata archaeon]|nr:FtsX-like permease family protein [Thermoplasmata archaeon]
MDTAVTLLVIVGAICLAVLAWAGRKRFPLRIGAGNFFRRKTQVAIVVAGLLIGTAIITSSLVIQSTFDFTVRAAVFRALDAVDEVVYVASPDGGRLPFSAQVYDNLTSNLASMPTVDRIAPRFQLSGAVVDTSSQLFEPTATIIGFDATRDLGAFVRSDGSTWDGSGLSGSEAIINAKLATAVEAKAGEGLIVSLGTPRGLVQIPVMVKEIVRDEGRGAWNDAENLFVPLPAFQAALGESGKINTITVANAGGPKEGYLRSDDVVREMTPFLPPTPTFTISKAKADSIDGASRNIDQLSQVFVLLGFFTVIAGILLIINIFVMLAEERKGEMGVARALGMRRTNLVQSFVSEGLLYALLSSVVGTFTGLLVAGVILWGFSQVFGASAFGGTGFILTWTNSDLINGFAIGFLITMATIVIASWRVSKLNIVRAIRDIPEPVPHGSTRRQVAAGAAIAVLGAIGFIVALLRENLLLQDLGPVGLAFGVAVLTMRALPARAVFTAAGAFIVGWVLSPWKFFSIANADITLFIAAGLMLVLGGLLVVLFNSDSILGIATRLVRRRTWRPVVRTAIAYPMNKKFRTGATLASIALVMFTIATMSGIQAEVSSSITETSHRESGGFQLLGASGVPIPNWDAAFAAYNATSVNVTENHGIAQARVRIASNANLSGIQHNSSLIGVPANWIPKSFPLQARALDYRDDKAAWTAIQSDPGLAIIDGTVVPNNFGPNFGSFSAVLGDVFHFRNVTGASRSVRIIGILYEQFAQGLWVSSSSVKADFGIDAASLFYFNLLPGVDVTQAGHDLERYFIAYQLITVNIQAVINSILETTMGVFNLLQAYLALGLIVGISGLGVITMRNVVERRQETGALRALGFRKSMVLKSFLFELSFIALTGIAMGVALGVALSYDLYLRFFANQAAFVIPWDRLLLLGGIAFIGAVLATASPAIRASRIPPAEALRSFE